MWEVRTQFSKPSADTPNGPMEWNAVFVDTEAEAEAWWQTRTSNPSTDNRVHTMFDPDGVMVRVQYN
jgi:hypothetical protein